MDTYKCSPCTAPMPKNMLWCSRCSTCSPSGTSSWVYLVSMWLITIRCAASRCALVLHNDHNTAHFGSTTAPAHPHGRPCPRGRAQQHPRRRTQQSEGHSGSGLCARAITLAEGMCEDELRKSRACGMPPPRPAMHIATRTRGGNATQAGPAVAQPERALAFCVSFISLSAYWEMHLEKGRENLRVFQLVTSSCTTAVGRAHMARCSSSTN